MADEQQQQTRVLLLNGQTIILQGDATDNAINEINADLLQQALQEVTGSTDAVEEPPRNEEYQQPPPAAENATPTNAAENNLVAIFHGDQGETHTIQLTVEQAEALGLHFMSDDSEKVTIPPDISQNVSTPQMAISNDQNQLVYSDNTSQPDETKTMFDPCITTESNIANIQDSTSLQGDTNSTSLHQNIGGLSALSEVGSYVGDSNNITLIPQFVNGQMTYTVKLNEQPSNTLQNQDFAVMDTEDHEPEPVIESKPKLPLLAPALPTNSLTSNSSPVATSVSSIRVNNIPSMINSLTPIAPALAQTSTTSTTYAAPKSLLSPLTNITPIDKSTKATYVVVPSSCTTVSASSAAVTHTSSGLPLAIKGSTLLRPRTVIPASASLQSTKTTTTVVSGSIPSSLHTPSTTATLTGIPLMNSNINITRTSAAGSSLLQSVSTSLTGGGMIRVVAGGSTTRMVQAPTTNGPKFTNILTPSGRLVAATTAQPTTQKIIPVNSTAGVAKTSVTTTAVSTTVTTEPLQSSAVSAVQSAAARLNINSTKPLGSSENPIQLVQHGQTFHSVQALSQEQLRQIATVLQQQHLDSAPRTKNVLYDAETNTRIIYRVVYPEDLDLREPSSPSEKHTSSVLASSGRGRGRRGRPPKSALRPVGRTGPVHESSLGMGRKPSGQAVDLDLDEDRLVDDAAKVERKKQVARTRSGRLSRPPRHMVKDYKRLHHLDFADADLDDSDGGYSDYQMSDREVEEQDASAKSNAIPPNTQGTPIPTNQDTTATAAVAASAAATTAATSTATTSNPATTTTTLLPGLQVSKRKISSHFRCPTCQKVYLGHSRMARHFDMFPDHGSIDQMKTNTSAAPSSPVPLPDSTQGRQVGIGSTLNGIVRPSGGRRRGKRRGPWAYTTPEARSERRKVKLREALATCEAAELSEVAGPAVAGVMSLWELLLLRVESVRTEESLMATLCEELRALLEKVQSVAGEVLQPAQCEEISTKEEQLELQDEILCNALGLPCGKYQIVDDHLLTRRAQSGFDMKVEPPLKRLKCDESDIKDEPKLEEIKPSCPEVLSALALESRPTTVSSLISNPVPPSVSSTIASTEASNSHPSSPARSSVDSEPTKTSQDNTPQSQDENMKEVDSVETKPVSDQEDEHPFLLPTTSDMCVEELTHEAVGGEGESHGTETVDDIVNERLKNLTGFTVSGPEGETVQSVSQEVVQFQDPHNSNDTEVPTFDPEMALAAMGEGEQPDSGTALSEFSPEIALAAMGEGDAEPPDTGTRHSPFASSVQDVFDPIKSMQDTVSLPNNSVPRNEESDQPKMNSPASAREVFSDLRLSNMDTSQSTNSAESKEEIVAFTTSILTNNSENTFITSLAEGSSISKCEGPSDSSVTNFDPEIALAAMGEGDPTGGNSESTFDPEMALASMGEGVPSVPSGQEFPQASDASGNEPAFQLTAMDVSLDESGPELDFDALSAEFTRSTRHS
ncbi:hypothetical protein R5R35_005329 [Gryllus longicercus]|uniref:DUF4764 domain-containing protein n=1 Tax=Gryllus longicercus TaxID=2509291 RepID=A0AAN9VK25_9ORTH